MSPCLIGLTLSPERKGSFSLLMMSPSSLRLSGCLTMAAFSPLCHSDTTLLSNFPSASFKLSSCLTMVALSAATASAISWPSSLVQVFLLTALCFPPEDLAMANPEDNSMLDWFAWIDLRSTFPEALAQSCLAYSIEPSRARLSLGLWTDALSSLRLTESCSSCFCTNLPPTSLTSPLFWKTLLFLRVVEAAAVAKLVAVAAWTKLFSVEDSLVKVFCLTNLGLSGSSRVAPKIAATS